MNLRTVIFSLLFFSFCSFSLASSASSSDDENDLPLDFFNFGEDFAMTMHLGLETATDPDLLQLNEHLFRTVQDSNAHGAFYFIQQGAEVDWGMLHIAILSQNFEMCNLLLTFLPEFVSRDLYGRLIESAAVNGATDIVVLLLDSLEDPISVLANYRNDEHETLLIAAAKSYRDNVDMLKLLLARGAPIDALDRNGRTCLYHALNHPDLHAGYANFLFLPEATGRRAYWFMTIQDQFGTNLIDLIDSRKPLRVWLAMEKIEDEHFRLLAK